MMRRRRMRRRRMRSKRMSSTPTPLSPPLLNLHRHFWIALFKNCIYAQTVPTSVLNIF